MLQMKAPTFVLDRDGNQVAAIIDIDSYRMLLATLEDLEDIVASRHALAEDPHGLPFDAAMREVERMAAEDAGVAQ